MRNRWHLLTWHSIEANDCSALYHCYRSIKCPFVNQIEQLYMVYCIFWIIFHFVQFFSLLFLLFLYFTLFRSLTLTNIRSTCSSVHCSQRWHHWNWFRSNDAICFPPKMENQLQQQPPPSSIAATNQHFIIFTVIHKNAYHSTDNNEFNSTFNWWLHRYCSKSINQSTKINIEHLMTFLFHYHCA